MSFLSRLFGRKTPEEQQEAKREEMYRTFPGLRRVHAEQERATNEMYARWRREAEAKAAGAAAPAAPAEPELDPADEAEAKEIKRLLLAASFHQGRDARAFENLSHQLRGMGDKLRASGLERWQRIRWRVREISGEHWAGLKEFYDLLGPEPAAAPAAASAAPSMPATTGRRILFGRRAIACEADTPAEKDGLSLLPAIDLAALSAAPLQMSRCTLVSHCVISGHAHPEPDVVQAWAGALGMDVQMALGESSARQALVSVQETGEQVLLVIWDDAVSREQVLRVAAAVQVYLGSS